MFERIWGVLLAAGGLLFVWDGRRLGREARADGMFDDLGPDRYIMLLGGLLAVAGVAIALQAKPDKEVQRQRPALWPPSLPVLFTLAIAGYALLMPWLGYTAATFLFFAVAFGMASRRPWQSTAAMSVVSTALSYVLFVRVANMPLPGGILGF
ncbi:tripartite tricarboxylate transporter TctB family protein [uncultured Enterovirga sp.]|uniref:tripartite tricarboxylate transporter TctB family protein n=1 Tax=uncultured Enterovirga sp. TaxID=2026352 RepID=UPI0035CB41F2